MLCLSFKKRPTCIVKETQKKVKEGVSSSCTSKPLIISHSCVNEDEVQLLAPSIDDNSKTERSVGNSETVNIEDEIIAAPWSPMLDDLHSRKMKRNKLLDCSTKLRKRAGCLVVATLTTCALLLVLLVQELDSGSDTSTDADLKAYSPVPTLTSSTLKDDNSGVICEPDNNSSCLGGCPAGQFGKRDPAGNRTSCWPCIECPDGFKSSVPCNSIVRYGTDVECIPYCERGITFFSLSDQRCQKCSQCQPKEIVVRPCRPAADAVCARCAPDQITWIDSKREIYGCFDCPICSSGFEPSPPCGSTVQPGVMIACKQCQEGETFSSAKNKEQCKRCSLCPPGQRVIVRCTKYFDTVCARPCGGVQITLVKWYRNQTLPTVECIDCLTCPAGMEPFVTCGTTVKNDVTLRCVRCRPGMTYSDLRSKHGCKPCTRCPPGKVVISNCSIYHDTRCRSRCTARQLSISINSTRTCVDCVKCSIGMEPKIPCGSLLNAWPRQQCVACKFGTFSSVFGTESCVPCRSCLDGTKRCTRILDSNCSSSKPLPKEGSYHEPVTFPLACSRCCNDGNDSYPRECAHLKPKKCEPRICSITSKAPSSSSAAPSSLAISIPLSTKPSQNNRTFSLTVVGFLIFGIVVLVSAAAVFALQRRRKRIKTHISVLGPARLAFRETDNSTESSTKLTELTGEMTLEELDARHMKTFDWMCRKLDKGKWRSRRDYERLASKYDRMTREQCESLQNELRTLDGSPTRNLMSLLQVCYPGLPLRHLARTLEEIGRHDIAKRLIPLILQGGTDNTKLISTDTNRGFSSSFVPTLPAVSKIRNSSLEQYGVREIWRHFKCRSEQARELMPTNEEREIDNHLEQVQEEESGGETEELNPIVVQLGEESAVPVQETGESLPPYGGQDSQPPGCLDKNEFIQFAPYEEPWASPTKEDYRHIKVVPNTTPVEVFVLVENYYAGKRKKEGLLPV